MRTCSLRYPVSMTLRRPMSRFRARWVADRASRRVATGAATCVLVVLLLLMAAATALPAGAGARRGAAAHGPGLRDARVGQRPRLLEGPAIPRSEARRLLPLLSGGQGGAGPLATVLAPRGPALPRPGALLRVLERAQSVALSLPAAHPQPAVPGRDALPLAARVLLPWRQGG